MEASRHFEPTPELSLVETQSFDTQIERQSQKQIDCLKVLSDNDQTVYYIFIDGNDSCVTLIRDDEPIKEYGQDFTYHLRFYGWEYGQAQIHAEDSTAAIEWAGVTDDLNPMEKLQARKLMLDSDDYLIAALKSDFPEASIEAATGDRLN